MATAYCRSEGTLTARSTVVADKEQIFSDLGGEAAILNLKDGVYYGLDAVGTRIWHLIQSPKTIQEIRDILLQEYEVEPARCESDLLALLGQLANTGLIQVHDATAA